MMIPRCLIGGMLLCVLSPAPAQEECGQSGGVQVQVLGSGGPEVRNKRASSSYLVWLDGKARVLVDAGGGAALRFGESGARVSDLDVILLSHLHVDHSADLPVLVKSSWFENRSAPLPLYGPPGNKFLPSTVAFVRTLFDPVRGGYRYLGEFISPLGKNTYKLRPYDVSLKTPSTKVIFSNERLAVYAAPVIHAQVPSLAWRVDIQGKRITFSGDTNGDGEALERLARNSDLLIAHQAIPEDAGVVERSLHMPPSVIGRIAGDAKVSSLVLSHRMLRTLGKEDAALDLIRKHYNGPVSFANDLDCYRP
jgi:ribonuclease BN (tRNA processing enzyme)